MSCQIVGKFTLPEKFHKVNLGPKKRITDGRFKIAVPKKAKSPKLFNPIVIMK